MATFIVLLDLTEKGIQNVRDSPKRSQEFRDAAKNARVTVKQVYWTLGGHDGLLVLEAPDAKTVAALTLTLGRRGYVRTRTLQAFESDEIQSILAATE